MYFFFFIIGGMLFIIEFIIFNIFGVWIFSFLLNLFYVNDIRFFLFFFIKIEFEFCL